jgi:hypothetical protein
MVGRDGATGAKLLTRFLTEALGVSFVMGIWGRGKMASVFLFLISFLVGWMVTLGMGVRRGPAEKAGGLKAAQRGFEFGAMTGFGPLSEGGHFLQRNLLSD